MRPLVAVVGPTASGKSAIAVEVAMALGGEIVNGDSRQIYRGMEIGTAAPTLAERSRVPHHLFAFRDPADSYSLALYQADARAAFEDTWAHGRVPFLVGGTGQYIWSLLEAWTVPEVAPDETFREMLRVRADREGADTLHAELAAIDPVAATAIDARNVRRVIRALEVHHVTGTPFSAWQRKGIPAFDYLVLGIDVPLDDLDRRIDARVEQMFAEGFVDEVKALLDGGLPKTAPAMAAIGYRQVADALARRCTVDSAKAATAQATRRLARNQLKWFRKDDARITWIRDAGEARQTVERWLAAQTSG